MSNIIYEVSSTLTAAGTLQTDALALDAKTSTHNVTTVAAGSGVQLPTTPSGQRIHIRNGGANPLKIWPQKGGNINSLAANAAFILNINESVSFTNSGNDVWIQTTNSLATSKVYVAAAATTTLTLNQSGSVFVVDQTA